MGSHGMLALLLLCILAVTALGSPLTYSVGGESGWSLGTPMSMPHLHVGDSIRFTYSPAEHDVLLVPQGDYESCSSSSPYAHYTSGNDYIPLKEPGIYHFICSIGRHCNAGMKLTVTVV